MKPAPFRHYATVAQAAALLARLAPEDGRVLAGGPSVVPALRRARPAHRIDVSVAALDRLAVADGNASCIGWTAAAARSWERPA